DAEQLKEQLALGKGDGEILEWIEANSATKPQDWEIVAWSAHVERRAPGDLESKEYFNEELAKLSKTREDVQTWADLLDLDDYVSYGGKA
ncbi:MAG TPA: DUF5069 domain-containing protein, partial [Terrimicrobiaceae bacterium]|nr:DUF5069 domain-containing protein [Terrimicrobiaceae bacterium]